MMQSFVDYVVRKLELRMEARKLRLEEKQIEKEEELEAMTRALDDRRIKLIKRREEKDSQIIQKQIDTDVIIESVEVVNHEADDVKVPAIVSLQLPIVKKQYVSQDQNKTIDCPGYPHISDYKHPHSNTHIGDTMNEIAQALKRNHKGKEIYDFMHRSWNKRISVHAFGDQCKYYFTDSYLILSQNDESYIRQYPIHEIMSNERDSGSLFHVSMNSLASVIITVNGTFDYDMHSKEVDVTFTSELDFYSNR